MGLFLDQDFPAARLTAFDTEKVALLLKLSQLILEAFQNELTPRYSQMHLSLSKNRWGNGGASKKKNRSRIASVAVFK